MIRHILKKIIHGALDEELQSIQSCEANKLPFVSLEQHKPQDDKLCLVKRKRYDSETGELKYAYRTASLREDPTSPFKKVKWIDPYSTPYTDWEPENQDEWIYLN